MGFSRKSNFFVAMSVCLVSMSGCAAQTEAEEAPTEPVEVTVEDTETSPNYSISYQNCDSTGGLYGLWYRMGSMFNYGPPPSAAVCNSWCGACGRAGSLQLYSSSGMYAPSMYVCTCY